MFMTIVWNEPWHAVQGYRSVPTAERPACVVEIMDRQARDLRLEPAERTAMVKRLASAED
jgi:hypothetical protein